MKFLKLGAWLLLIGAVVYGGFACFALLKEKLNPQSFFKQPIGKFEFCSDGVLDSRWGQTFLKFPRGIDIMEVDIFSLKKQMETCEQIKAVRINRRFPDTIRIDVEERIPILRLKVRDGKSLRELFVDGEGVVFSCEKISEIDRKMMPFLGGVVLRKTADGRYEKIEALEKVCALLRLAKVKYWSIYAQMEVISVGKLRKKNVPWSHIDIRFRQISSVIFKDYDFDEQLKRLNFLLSTPQIKNNLPLQCIDLRSSKDATVHFSTN